MTALYVQRFPCAVRPTVDTGEGTFFFSSSLLCCCRTLKVGKQYYFRVCACSDTWPGLVAIIVIEPTWRNKRLVIHEVGS